jgi:hypothetical protein
VFYGAAVRGSAAFLSRAAITTLIGVAAVLGFAHPAAAAPNTRITAGPTGLVATGSPTFRFAASVARTQFKCKLDGRPWGVCTSPKRYRGLAQGPHTFRVRALKQGSADPTPATRRFAVDTIPPSTTILSGPTGVVADHSPSFTFSASEGTLECKLATAGFAPCTSPFTPASPLPDESYVFEVRARDKAGNLDATPATRAFSVNTPLTEDLPTAQAAAALYFPATADRDVVASCGGSTPVDCPGGVPAPAAPQLRVASSTPSLVAIAGTSRYDVSVTQGVSTLAPIKVTIPLVGDCNLTLTSANGTQPTWNVFVSLQFVIDSTTGERRILHQNLTTTGVEAADFTLTGSVACALANAFNAASIGNLYTGLLADSMSQVGWALCAAPGPAYLGPCPPP